MIDRFVARRRSRWERLAALLGRHRRLSVDELDELARLYRQTTGDLAVARRDFPHDPATAVVNRLVSQGYAVIYRESPAPFSALRRFFAQDFPREWRAAWPYLLLSAGFLFGPLILTAAAVVLDRDVAEVVVSPQLLGAVRDGRTWFEWEFAESPLAASFLMTHNIQVALVAIGGGLLAGIATVWVLLSNGISIGGVSGALVAYGLGDRLLGFVAPHGFLELSAVVNAGACGLMLGRSLLWPGLQTRREALAAAGRRMVRLALPSMLLLVPAGLIEGFISPLAFPWPLKVLVGIMTAVLLYGYLLLGGRSMPGLRRLLQARRAVTASPAP